MGSAKHKARYVVKGYSQKEDIDCHEHVHALPTWPLLC